MTDAAIQHLLRRRPTESPAEQYHICQTPGRAGRALTDVRVTPPHSGSSRRLGLVRLTKWHLFEEAEPRLRLPQVSAQIRGERDAPQLRWVGTHTDNAEWAGCLAQNAGYHQG